MSDNVSNEMMMDVQGWRIYIPKEGMWINDDERAVRPLWDCIHDLNLVRRIEAGLPEMERTHYLNLLANEVVENDDDNMGVGFDGLSYIGSFMVVCATAQQRCNALYPILFERNKK
jgi:hypothetical protein